MTHLSALALTRPGDTREGDRGEDWRTRGACLTEDPETFFPHPSDLDGIEAAKAICRGCPVVEVCASYALDTRQRDGVWGALDEADRTRALRRQKRRPL